MAAFTSDATLRVINPHTHKFILDTSAAQTVYRGEPLIIDQTADAANVTPYHDTTHPETKPTDVFMGVAAEGKSVLISSAETLLNGGIEAYIAPTIVGYKSAVFTNADAGKTACFADGVLTATATDAVPLGLVAWVEDGYCYIELVTPAICANAGA